MRAALAIDDDSDLQRAGRALSALRYVRRSGACVRTRRANYTEPRPIASAPELTERTVARGRPCQAVMSRFEAGLSQP